MLESLFRRSSGGLEKKLHLAKENVIGIHSVLRWTLFLGRVIGLLPLVGLTNPRSHDLKFIWRSYYIILYIASMSGQILMFIMSFYWLLHNKISLTNISFVSTPFGVASCVAFFKANFLFYSSSTISFLLLTNIGRSWPSLVHKVEEIERKLPPLPRNASTTCNITMIAILLAALVEHILSILYGITVARSCDPGNIAETFFNYDKPWIFTYFTYSLWKGVLIEVFNIQSTFIWSYNDLLIMIISIYLTEHFKVHNRLLKTAFREKQYSCDEFRPQHLEITRLVKLVNEKIGIYILICFGSNLYWICTQLFHSLNTRSTGHFVSCHSNAVHGADHTVYFTYSFSFLVARTLLVLLLAARVNSASVVPLILLFEIPTQSFSVEAERFIGQINNIKVALSGLGFFYVTRTMILTLLGTIVTYELVLVQFNK